MKKSAFFLFYIISTLILSQENDICGKWLEEKKQSHIEIYKTQGNHYEGKIVWLAEPLDENGNMKKDNKNPDTQLRSQTIDGLVIVKDLKYLKNDEWGKGSIYDARSGKTYSLNAKLKDQNTLFMRGYLGFSLIGRTTTWTRVN